MTHTCARCGETHDDDTPLCALCAARVELDNAEVDYLMAVEKRGWWFCEELADKVQAASVAYFALCLTGKSMHVEKKR